MARKKKEKTEEVLESTAEVIDRPFEVDPEYKDEDGNFRLPRAQYWKYRALSAEIEKTTLEYNKAKADFEAIVLATTSLMHCRSLMAEAKGKSAQFVAEINEFHKEVEAATGLKLKECAFDDRTGHINVIPS